MANGSRRPLYTAAYVHRVFGKMRADLAAHHSQMLAELAAMRAELEATKQAYANLRAAVLARQSAEAEVAELHRRRALTQAWAAAERDPAARLQ